MEFQDLITFIEKDYGMKKKNAIWVGKEKEVYLQS